MNSEIRCTGRIGIYCWCATPTTMPLCLFCQRDMGYRKLNDVNISQHRWVHTKLDQQDHDNVVLEQSVEKGGG